MLILWIKDKTVVSKENYPIFGCITRGLSEFKSGFYTKKQVCGLCGSAGNTANLTKIYLLITLVKLKYNFDVS